MLPKIIHRSSWIESLESDLLWFCWLPRVVFKNSDYRVKANSMPYTGQHWWQIHFNWLYWSATIEVYFTKQLYDVARKESNPNHN